MPITLQNRSEEPQAAARLAVRRRPVSDDDRLFLIEQLALLLETGSSLHQALGSMAAQTRPGALLDLLTALSEAVSAGKPFSTALADHPKVFSSTYVNLVAASEQGGFMHEVLAELLAMEEKRRALRATLVAALSYPIFLVIFSAIVVIFVLLAVFPKFAPMFATIYDQLPATTRVLLGVSESLQTQWPIYGGGLLVLAATAFYWRQSAGGRRVLDQLKIDLPVVGTVTLQVYSVQILRVLSLSLANGVRVPEALAAASEVVANLRVQTFMRHVQDSVQQGAGIARGFKTGGLMPDLVNQMVATGEESGELARVASRLADYYEKELTKKLNALSRMAEPIMLLVMGVIVGTLVSSLILPIFKLSRVVN